jgi:hypothetical protein
MPRSIKLIALGVLVLVLALSSAQSAFAVPGVLDQQQTDKGTAAGFYTGALPPPSQLLGQTFKAGVTGTLVEVDIVIACVTPTGADCSTLGDVTMEIHSGDATGTLLGSSSLPASAIPKRADANLVDFVAFTFSSPPSVAGTDYTFLLKTSNAASVDPHYDVGASLAAPYTAGVEWVSHDNGATWTSNSLIDLAFKTFVAPAVIPEYPFGLPLLAIFMVISYGLIRRRTSTRRS